VDYRGVTITNFCASKLVWLLANEVLLTEDRLCCINSVGRSSSVARFTSGSDIEDVEQLVYEAHLVFDMRLTREAMSSADHPHHLEPFIVAAAVFIV